MPLMTERVLDSQRRIPERSSSKGTSHIPITQISPCAYGTYLNVHKIDSWTNEEPDPQDKLRMKDGHWQERQIVADLVFAGFELKFVLEEQLKVTVGESEVPGRPDGIIVTQDESILEIKAMDSWRWSKCKSKGIAHAEPFIRCQIQCYMNSPEIREMDINSTRIYTKHKDSCLPYDYVEPYDPDYVKPIVDAMDRIILEGYKPEKEGCALCSLCGHRLFCWEATETIDFRGIDTEFEMGEFVDQWRQGKAYIDAGDLMVTEARSIFEKRMGDNDSLMIGDLKVLRVQQHRTSIPTSKYVDAHGNEGLGDVLVDNQFSQLRITDTTVKRKKKDSSPGKEQKE